MANVSVIFKDLGNESVWSVNFQVLGTFLLIGYRFFHDFLLFEDYALHLFY